jgi:hypothetical protein
MPACDGCRGRAFGVVSLLSILNHEMLGKPQVA